MLIKLDSDFFCTYIDFLNIPDAEGKSFLEAFELISNSINTAIKKLSYTLYEFNKVLYIYLDADRKKPVNNISDIALCDGFICVKGSYIGPDCYAHELNIRFPILQSARQQAITDNALYISDNNLDTFLKLLYKNTDYEHLIPAMFTLLTLKEK